MRMSEPPHRSSPSCSASAQQPPDYPNNPLIRLWSSAGVYRPLFDGSHGRHGTVHAYVSESLRLALTAAHPAATIRVHFVERILEFVLVGGRALTEPYEGSFYSDRVAPIEARVEQAIETLALLRSRIERSQ
jgi:hypothetical protein